MFNMSIEEANGLMHRNRYNLQVTHAVFRTLLRNWFHSKMGQCLLQLCSSNVLDVRGIIFMMWTMMSRINTIHIRREWIENSVIMHIHKIEKWKFINTKRHTWSRRKISLYNPENHQENGKKLDIKRHKMSHQAKFKNS